LIAEYHGIATQDHRSRAVGAAGSSRWVQCGLLLPLPTFQQTISFTYSHINISESKECIK
jgi:hypothetical protein